MRLKHYLQSAHSRADKSENKPEFVRSIFNVYTFFLCVCVVRRMIGQRHTLASIMREASQA